MLAEVLTESQLKIYVMTIIIIAQADAEALWWDHAQHTGETKGGLRGWSRVCEGKRGEMRSER